MYEYIVQDDREGNEKEDIWRGIKREEFEI